MKKEPSFYTDPEAGTIVQVICGGHGEVLQNGGLNLRRLQSNDTEAVHEKHLPVVRRYKNAIRVEVGEVFHPMTPEHSIGFVYLETERGGQRVDLKPDEEPVADFVVPEGDVPIAAYAYCNLHGFWRTEI